MRIYQSKISAIIMGLALSVAGAGTAQAGMVVLDSGTANGIGSNGGNAFEFSFSSNAPKFEGALLEFADYDLLGITVSDSTGDFVQPLIANAPGQSFLFSFAAGGAGDYIAKVFTSGNGAFGLEIQAVPIPAAAILFASALGITGLLARRRKAA